MERFKAAMTTETVKCRGGIERESNLWIFTQLTLIS